MRRYFPLSFKSRGAARPATLGLLALALALSLALALALALTPLTARAQEPAVPPDPAAQAAPADPVEPVEPVDPVEPVEPVDPFDPVEPVEPVEPAEPAAPANPTAPADSVALVLGEDYREAVTPLPLLAETEPPLELVYIFWYGCGTCRRLDPLVSQFFKTLAPDVKFTSVPALFAPNATWMAHGKLFFALEYLGKEKALHAKVFAAVQDNLDSTGHGGGLTTFPEQLAFAKENGIAEADFAAAYNSPEVERRIQAVLAFVDNLDIDSVPAMGVGGRYSFSISRAGAGRFFQTAEALLEAERARLASPAQN
ncbi:MAG: thiol:disulfide interchange protein DsbA/DsbL [Deltaproteobacteria bacterium]|nr:thiol:disulfide interchange protein DsbA/DsbL [Deltaproteobacteria bacterium]